MLPFRHVAPLVLLALMVLPDTALGQIYKVTDKDGNVSFTDRPPEEGEGVTIETLSISTTRPTQPPPGTAGAQSDKTEDQPAPKYTTEVTSPADGSTIPMGEGSFSVVAALAPPLGPDERVQLRVDGAVAGGPQRSNTWALTNVFRGEHIVTVQRVDDGGNVLDTSEPITVTILRTGQNR